MGIKFLQNIDAERNKFEEAGFEVVNALPTTNLFVGRQVVYNGRIYVYNGNTWIDWYNPAPVFVEPYPYTMTTEELSHGATAIGGTVNIQLLNSISSSLLSIIDDVSGDNYLIETNDGSGWSVVNGSVSAYRRIPVGLSIRYTAFKDMNQSLANLGLGYFFAVYKDGNYRLDTTSRYDIEFYFPNDKGVSHWKTVYSQQFDSDEGNYWFFPVQKYWRTGTNNNQEITNARITITTVSSINASYPETVVSGIKFLTNRQLTIKTTPVYLNYDAVIKPTESTTTYKTIEWVLQYLTQGVNWLRDNHLPLAGGTMTGDLTVPKLIKTGGTATQALMADGSTKDISGFASSDDIPTQLPNPNPIIIKTADGVSVRYDGSTSGGVILEAGDNAELTATQDSDDTMTVKFDAVVPTKLPNPQSLQIQVLDDAGAVLGSDILYDGLTAKILKLVAGYGIELNSVNLTGGQAVGINLKQIAGTTLLGNANGTTGTPQAVTMAQLRTMLGYLTLNDISVTLGGNSSYTLPCYIDYNGTRYQCRISSDATGLQIYRDGVWRTIGKFCRCSTRGTITNSNIDNWYKDTVPNYEMDESVSADLYGKDLRPKFGSSIAGKWTGKTVTLNLASVSIKDTKSAWEMLKKNMGDCFPADSVEKIRYYYNVAIPSGEVVTKIELSYHNGVGMCTVHFYTEG